MEQTEKIFFAERAHIASSTPKDKLKIGEIFQYKDGSTSLFCIHCSQEFHFYTEFTLHIQEHYLRNEIFLQVDNIKCEGEAEFIDNISMPVAEISVKCEKFTDIQPDDINDGYYRDIHNIDTAFNNSYSNEGAISLSKGNLIFDKNNHSKDNDNYIKSMRGDYENQMFFEEAEQTQLENSAQIEDEPILNIHYKKVDGRFQCLLCPKLLPKYIVLKDHYLIHVGKKNVFCPLCAKGFISIGYVQKHCTNAHQQSVSREMIRQAQTNMNDFKTTPVMKNKNSDKVATQDTPIKIPELLKSHQESLEENELILKRYKRVDGKYQCLICSASISDMCYLKKHHLIHGDKNIFCPICSRTFISVDYVQKHCYNSHKLSISKESIRKAQGDVTEPEIAQPRKDTQEEYGQILKQHEQFYVHKQQMSKESTKDVPEDKEPMKIRWALNTLGAKVVTEKTPKLFQCLFCTKRFDMPHHVRRHIRFEHNTKLGLEEIVTAQQNPELKLKDFLVDTNKHKKATKNFECFLCHRQMDTITGLKHHMNVHAEKKIGCPLCSRPFSQSRYVRSHLVMKHGLNKDEITTEMVTKNIADLPKPEPPKQEVRDYECVLCKKHYMSRESLRQHMRSHNKSYLDESLLCPICGAVFRRAITFRSHMEVHEAGTSRDFKCDLCGKMFQTRRYLMIHKRRVHTRKRFIRKEPRHKCKECGEIFPSWYKLKLHVELHTTTGPIESRCEICDMTFARPRGLQDHMIVHSDNNKTTCNICGKEVSTRYLSHHLKIHSGDKEFECDKCDMAFRNQTSLRNHMLRHEEGEMKFKCSKCSRAFRRQNKYLLHLRALHPELLPFNCSKCGKGFLTFRSLKKHENEHFREENVVLQLVKPN